MPDDATQPPQKLVFKEHVEDLTRLAILDVKTKKKRYLPLLPGELERFLWSVEKNVIAYVLDDSAFLHFIDTGLNKPLSDADVLNFESVFVFIPNSFRMVVATMSGFQLIDFEGDTPKALAMFPYPNQAEPVSLLCSAKGLTLLSLSPVVQDDELHTLTLTKLADGQQKSQNVTADRLLGWQDSEPVACRSGQVFGEFIGTIGRNAHYKLWSFDEDGLDNQDYPEVSESYVHSYLSEIDLVVLSSAIEHSADPLELFLASEKKKSIEPWLESFERIIDIKFSASGHWAVFTHAPLEEPSATEGDIYLARVGSEDAELMLKAIIGGAYYSLASLGV